MKKLKNSLELPNPTRNTRKFANNLMLVTSDEINLQSIIFINVFKSRVIAGHFWSNLKEATNQGRLQTIENCEQFVPSTESTGKG